MSVIEVEHLSRSFTRRKRNQAVPAWRRAFAPALVETHEAVRDLSFGIAAGEKVAFIGPNGAGKSTTLKMLCGILHPSGGSATVAGFVPWQQTPGAGEQARHRLRPAQPAVAARAGDRQFRPAGRDLQPDARFL